MATEIIPQDFKDFLKLLEDESVAYLLIGGYFEHCFNRRNRVNIAGLKVNLISLDDLKINKKASGRYKDLEDLEHLP